MVYTEKLIISLMINFCVPYANSLESLGILIVGRTPAIAPVGGLFSPQVVKLCSEVNNTCLISKGQLCNDDAMTF